MELQMPSSAAMFITMGPAERANSPDEASNRRCADDSMRSGGLCRRFYSLQLLAWNTLGADRANRIEQSYLSGAPTHRPFGLISTWAPRFTDRQTASPALFERVLRAPAGRAKSAGTRFMTIRMSMRARVMLARALWMQGFTEQGDQ